MAAKTIAIDVTHSSIAVRSVVDELQSDVERIKSRVESNDNLIKQTRELFAEHEQQDQEIISAISATIGRISETITLNANATASALESIDESYNNRFRKLCKKLMIVCGISFLALAASITALILLL